MGDGRLKRKELGLWSLGRCLNRWMWSGPASWGSADKGQAPLTWMVRDDEEVQKPISLISLYSIT